MGLNSLQAEIVKNLPPEEQRAFLSCSRKRVFSTLGEALDFSLSVTPKGANFRYKAYPCQHLHKGQFHITQRHKKVTPVCLPNTLIRDKMIRTGLLNGTAPIAQQKPQTKLVKPLRFTWQIARTCGASLS